MVKVITYGTFDLFHDGHYRLLQRAKALGDYLIVGVTTESYDEIRGKLNVVDPLLTRIENVRKTGFADEIIIEESQGQKFRDIQKYHIDVFTVGSDWSGCFDYLKDYCRVVYLERTKNVSSTMLREKNRKILRMGIIGTGRIANRFIPESKRVSGIDIICAYNPHIESAEAFCAKYDIDCAASMEELLEKTDAVYIASPHETHYEYARTALMAKKHVLCEKPMSFKGSQVRELFETAKDNGVILFEGIKTAYCPGFTKLMSIACSGMIGSIRSVCACFTKLENAGNRELTDPEYGGSFTELGSYTLLPIIKIFGKDYENLSFEYINGENGVDIYTKAHVRYSKGLSTAVCGLGVKSPGQLVISGTTGYIVAEAPWWKTTYFEVHHEDPNQIEKYSERYLGDGLRYEICDFLSMINGDNKCEFKLTRGDSIAIAEIMEKFLNEHRQDLL